MSLLAKLGNLVFENESAPAETTESTATTTSTTSDTTTSGTTASNVYTEDQQKMFNSMLETLTEQVFTRTTSLVQFRNALKSLEPVIPDANTRYKAAFAMLSSSGVSVEALLNAIKIHTTDLQTEVTRFNQNTEEKRQEVVIQPTEQIKNRKDTTISLSSGSPKTNFRRSLIKWRQACIGSR